MVEHLSILVENFPGAPNQTRCFSHILNLVAKSVLHQFDAPKKKANEDSDDLVEATSVLAELTRELELDESAEEDQEDEEGQDDSKADDADKEDNEPHDERDGMLEDELLELEASLIPARLMLAKVKFDSYVSLSISDIICTASSTLKRHQELVYHPSPSMELQA